MSIYPTPSCVVKMFGLNFFLGVDWVIGAMSTAKWGGVKLRDVLEECGINVDDIALGKVESPFQHLQMEG